MVDLLISVAKSSQSQHDDHEHADATEVIDSDGMAAQEWKYLCDVDGPAIVQYPANDGEGENDDPDRQYRFHPNSSLM